MLACDLQNLRNQLHEMSKDNNGLQLTSKQTAVLIYHLQDMETRAAELEKEVYGQPSLEDIAGGSATIEHGGNVVSITSHFKHPHHNNTGDLAS